MSWTETERDERYRVKFTVYQCSLCGKRAVSTVYAPPSACVCKGRR